VGVVGVGFRAVTPSHPSIDVAAHPLLEVGPRAKQGEHGGVVAERTGDVSAEVPIASRGRRRASEDVTIDVPDIITAMPTKEWKGAVTNSPGIRIEDEQCGGRGSTPMAEQTRNRSTAGTCASIGWRRHHPRIASSKIGVRNNQNRNMTNRVKVSTDSVSTRASRPCSAMTSTPGIPRCPAPPVGGTRRVDVVDTSSSDEIGESIEGTKCCAV